LRWSPKGPGTTSTKGGDAPHPMACTGRGCWRVFPFGFSCYFNFYIDNRS
jgi:hypothetical protein